MLLVFLLSLRYQRVTSFQVKGVLSPSETAVYRKQFPKSPVAVSPECFNVSHLGSNADEDLMPLVAYAVSAEAMCQLQFWAGQENYREYQKALWTVGEEILRADHLESNVVSIFLDWLASEYGGMTFSTFQPLPFSLDPQEGFFVYLVMGPAEQPRNLCSIQPLSSNKVLLHSIPAAFGMKPGREEDFVSVQTFLHDAFRLMADRKDETLVISSC